MKINILIVDDHQLIIEGLKSVLINEVDFNVVACAKSGYESIRICDNQAVDVILMDYSMPGINGDESTRQIISKHPNTKVIAITMHGDIVHLNKMIHAGAVGYLLKSAKSEEIVSSIRKVMNGGTYFSSEIKIVDTPNESSTIEELDIKLSEREIEVISLISKGKTNIEIAELLNISSRTVQKHRSNAMEKIGVSNFSGVLRYAFAHGLI